MAQKEIYLTRDALARLESELDHLRNVRRIEVTERLHNAKELTGTEESSDYEDAKTEQAFVEGRILELDTILKNPVIIDEHHAEDGRVSIGTRFTVRDDSGEEDTYTLVGTTEADATHGRISNESPVGSAVIGHKVGDMVEVSVPDGTISYTIVSVE